jgi:hypothetical protein
VKFKFFSNDDAGVAAAAGILWNTPLNQRSGQDSWGHVYANVSKKVNPGIMVPASMRVLMADWREPGHSEVKPQAFSDARAGVISGTNSRYTRKPASSPIGSAARTRWLLHTRYSITLPAAVC